MCVACLPFDKDDPHVINVSNQGVLKRSERCFWNTALSIQKYIVYFNSIRNMMLNHTSN